MVSASQTPGITDIILGLIAYGSLFALTIRQNRKNRPVVLGVVTVSMFFGFLLFASLDQKHVPSWLLALVALLIILTGLFILGIVAIDILKWAAEQRKPDAHEKDPTAASKSGAK
jgi:4-amino-4-deoxy-L-arabinose transferase-like glycosyltransferase